MDEANAEEIQKIQRKGGMQALAAFAGAGKKTKVGEMAMKANVVGKFRKSKGSKGSLTRQTSGQSEQSDDDAKSIR